MNDTARPPSIVRAGLALLLTWLSLVVFVPVAFADGPEGSRPEGLSPSETLDANYLVYLPPGALETLNPWIDKFDLAVRRKTPSDTVRSMHLLISVSRGGAAIVRREETLPLEGGSRVEFQMGALVPFWPVVINGQFASLLPKWQYEGFEVRIELREEGPDGHVVFASRDPNKPILVSWPGVFECYGWVLTVIGLLLGLAVALRDARRVGAPGPRRRAVLFDLGALALVPLLPVAFGRYAVLLAIPAAILLGFVRLGFKAGWTGALREGGLRGRAIGLLSPALMTAVLCSIWLLWHESLIRTFNFAPADFSEVLLPLTALYFWLALLVAILIHRSAFRARRGGRAPKALWIVVFASILVSAFLRRLDWGIFYQTSAHADEEFWYHAFYRQNATLLTSDWAAWVFGTLAIELILVGLLLWLADRFARTVVAFESRQAARPGVRWLTALLLLNAVVAFVGVTLVHRAALTFWQPASRDISGSIFEAFGGVPEFKMIEPLVHGLLRDPPAPPAPLDADYLGRLERAMGVRMQSCGTEYPLVKPSIYLAPSDRAVDLPRVPPGTNVIYLVVESLSSGLLDDEAQGVPGLTKNFHAFEAESFSLGKLWSSEFPTLRGEIADLGSFMFGRGGNVTSGDVGKVVRSRFLLLSDILKTQRGYTTVMAQSDYGTFAGTAGVFLRHHFDKVLTAEDAEILDHAKNGLVKTWGVFDEDLYGAVVDMLQKGSLPQPFLLTIATTDTHFPYATLRHHPAAGGNSLLDSIYSADVAFGVFWDYFKNSPYAQNTLLVVIADHALVTRAFRRADGGRRLSQFDYLTGMIHIPGDTRLRGVKKEGLVSQLDMLPTVLDLLDMDVENPFLGLSVFSGRDRFPLVPTGELPGERLTDAEKDAMEATGWSADDQARLLEHLTSLGLADRIRPAEGSACVARPADAAGVH